MSLFRWFDRVFRPASTRRPVRRSFARPQLEALEDRLTPAGSINITNALLVDAQGNALTAAPDKGEAVTVKALFTTQGLPANASYSISYTVAGVTHLSGALTWGAGNSGTQNWNARL